MSAPELEDTLAERAVLGSMILSPEIGEQVAEILNPADFYRPAHATIYTQLLNALVRGEPTDAVSIGRALAANGDLDRIGGAPYLHDLLASVATAASATWHARQILELATRRRIAAAAIRIHQQATDITRDTADVIEGAQTAIHHATASHQRSDATAFGDGLDEAIDAICAPGPRDRGLSTGIGCLDEIIAGLKPGQLIIIGARPGAGKSVLAVDMARAAAFRAKEPVLLRSLEMSTNEVRMRILASECSINLWRVTNGPIYDDEIPRLRAAADRLRSAPLYIDDSPGGDIPSIRANARRIQQRHGLGLVIVDYLQLMTPTGTNEGRAQEVAGLSRGLKLLARELNVPVVAPAQLNRQSESRTDKRPQLSDLRESGGIEADADVVVLLHRPDLNEPEHARAGEIDLIVCKNRNGSLATTTAAAQLQFVRIVDMIGS